MVGRVRNLPLHCMKIAIFHDYFGTIGGGERVVITMARSLDADIITTDTDAIRKLDPSVRVISLGATSRFPLLKQMSATLKFYLCDFSGDYDFFIFSGNWAHYAAHRHHPNLWYCHTPVRIFYDLRETFLCGLPVFIRPLFSFIVFFYSCADKRSLRHIDWIIANSRNVQKRIQQFYHRESDVVFPPVDSSAFSCREYGSFWLSVNRIYPEKRIELQVDTFRSMPYENLIIVGGSGIGDHSENYRNRVAQNLPKNVLLKGEVPEEELKDLYSRCKGIICTARDEDFGLTPLEAMASGKAVIAVREGGFTETVTPDTGIFVSPEPASIREAIRQISVDPGRYHDACIRRAGEFGIHEFEKKIRASISESVKT